MTADREIEKNGKSGASAPAAFDENCLTEEEEGYFSGLSCTIRNDGVDERLDTFLGRLCPDRSRSHFKKLIQEGHVLVNGRQVKAAYELRFGDHVSVTDPVDETASDRLTPQPMPLDILYEDEDILVVAKAPGIVVHPGAGHEEGTLVHGMLAHCTRLASQGAPRRPGIVHRLDRDTSGALVVAKSDLAYLDLIEQFKGHEVEKEYLALVYGHMPQRTGEIRTRMDRHPADRKKMAVVENRGREAVSRWKVEKEWQELSLLNVAIETGRTHQIRVHCSYLQHPVVGDETYGGGRRRARSVRSIGLRDLLLRVERQMLHARRLSFMHPRTHEKLSFTAPPPPDFSGLLEEIERLFPAASW
ncbi:MAG: RluA family pseudouridine synthase [Syntrophobacteraceae bacterium]|nr:RluA family pseudouridine synthase [Desulfobacteraceae bacterium]